MRVSSDLSIISMDSFRDIGLLIGERFEPEQVILFGSYARGEGKINSDLDLLVVMESPMPRFKRSAAIRSALSEYWTEPFDIVIRSPERFAHNKVIPFTLEYEAANDGVVLYEKRIQ